MHLIRYKICYKKLYTPGAVAISVYQYSFFFSIRPDKKIGRILLETLEKSWKLTPKYEFNFFLLKQKIKFEL